MCFLLFVLLDKKIFLMLNLREGNRTSLKHNEFVDYVSFKHYPISFFKCCLALVLSNRLLQLSFFFLSKTKLNIFKTTTKKLPRFSFFLSFFLSGVVFSLKISLSKNEFKCRVKSLLYSWDNVAIRVSEEIFFSVRKRF